MHSFDGTSNDMILLQVNIPHSTRSKREEREKKYEKMLKCKIKEWVHSIYFMRARSLLFFSLAFVFQSNLKRKCVSLWHCINKCLP